MSFCLSQTVKNCSISKAPQVTKMPLIRKEILRIHSLLLLLNLCTLLCSLGSIACFSIEENVESSRFWACVAGVTVPYPESNSTDPRPPSS